MNRALTDLDLSVTAIDDEGAESLAIMLKVAWQAGSVCALKQVNCTLTSINLSENFINDAAAAFIGDALKVERACARHALHVAGQSHAFQPQP